MELLAIDDYNLMLAELDISDLFMSLELAKERAHSKERSGGDGKSKGRVLSHRSSRWSNYPNFHGRSFAHASAGNRIIQQP